MIGYVSKENQKDTANAFEKVGYCNCGDILLEEEKTLNNIILSFERLITDFKKRSEISESARQFIDGQGARRIVWSILEWMGMKS